MRFTPIRAVILALLLSVPTAALAHPDGAFAERMVERMQEKLDLTDEQADGVTAVFTQVREACEGTEFGKEKRECLREQKDGAKEQLREILDKDQLKELRKMREKRQDRRCEARRR